MVEDEEMDSMEDDEVCSRKRGARFDADDEDEVARQRKRRRVTVAGRVNEPSDEDLFSQWAGSAGMF